MARTGSGVVVRISAIDIGTNTVLLLVADIDTQGTIVPLAYEQRIPRLGKDVDAQRVIGRPAFERAVSVLQEYKAISQRLQSEHLIAAGTSAVRDATNKSEFLEFIKRQTGITVEVLDGEEEARLTYFGAISGVASAKSTFCVIDIGGGSTEITAGTRDEIRHTMSLDIGSVRIKERFLNHEPPLLAELRSASEFVGGALKTTDGLNLAKATILGVAGTVTTLAALDQGMEEFNREKITSYRLSSSAVERLYAKLREMRVGEITSLSKVTHGRADILTAGTLILREFLTTVGAREIVVSERGVRYGLALREWRKLASSR